MLNFIEAGTKISTQHQKTNDIVHTTENVHFKISSTLTSSEGARLLKKCCAFFSCDVNADEAFLVLREMRAMVRPRSVARRLTAR